MNYEEARNYIAHIQGNLGSDYSLKEVTRLAEYMDRPDKKLQIVHIAGTNGKGSAGNYLAGILAASGYRVGRYVSPTTHYLERVQKWEPYTEQAVTISAQEAAKLLTKLRVFCEQMVKEGYHHPTAFEIETILAMQQGVDWNVDVMLVECGLGGRMDATNFITDPLLCMITSISRDHMAVLGETVTEIAEEKYGIIKKEAQVISAPPKELQPLLERVCRETGAHLHLVQSVGQVQIHSCEETQFYYRDRSYVLSTPGLYQIDNAALALETAQCMQSIGFAKINEESMKRGIYSSRWPGRMEVICKKPIILLDGAHNEDAAKRLVQSLEAYYPGQKWQFIMGVFADKEYQKMIHILLPYAKRFLTVTAPGPRGLDSGKLAKTIWQTAQKFGENRLSLEDIQDVRTMSDALYQTLQIGENTIICGSLSIQGAVQRFMSEAGEMEE